MKNLLLTCFCLFWWIHLNSQSPTYSANDTVPPFDAAFGMGANVGTANGWTDFNFANIAAGNPDLSINGIGLNTLRQWLPEWFLEAWGYDIRKDEYAFYSSLGIENLVVFIGGASDQHKNRVAYCPGLENQSFGNLYEPIWDTGQGGTPVNDSNYFALYCYRLAIIYGEEVKVWEVLNEPDLDLTGNAILEPGMPGNWWDNDPNPCDIQFGAPITEYVRMLRIAYEVIKSVRPDNLIAVGGLGHPAFLDAILRNTDNPDAGKVTAAFPLKGGAYFDCMSFHSYPHFDGSLQYWDNDDGEFKYNRHSDAAVKGLFQKRDELEDVLTARGYDDGQYPSKHWINTETNVPRKSFLDKTLFGAEAQKNYMMKSTVAAMKAGFKQIHYYSLFETEELDDAVNDWQMMGYYKALTGSPHEAELTDAGLGMQTLVTFMEGYQYDEELTGLMNLPDRMDGGAFYKANEKPLFVIWAKTWRDSSEAGEFIYEFPGGFEIKELLCYEWNFNHTGLIQVLQPDYVHTPSSPIFLIPEYLSSSREPVGNAFELLPNPADDYIQVRLVQSASSVVKILITDAFGKVLIKEMMGAGQFQCMLDVAHFVPGIYHVHLHLDGVIHSEKLFIK